MQTIVEVQYPSTFYKMNNLKFRAAIEILVLEGKQPQEINERMNKAYGPSAPSYSTEKKWAAEFKRGHQSLEDDARQGRPSEAVTPEICQEDEDMIRKNRRIKVREIAHDLNISVGSVETILHEHLCMTKFAAQRVPRLFTNSMKKARADCCKELLHLYYANPNEFLSRVITSDETWLHHWDPEKNKRPCNGSTWDHHPQEGSYSSIGRESHGHNLLEC